MAVVLMGTWTGHFLGGFSWQSDPQHQFNWHPLLMTIGLIFLYGNGECVIKPICLTFLFRDYILQNGEWHGLMVSIEDCHSKGQGFKPRPFGYFLSQTLFEQLRDKT